MRSRESGATACSVSTRAGWRSSRSTTRSTVRSSLAAPGFSRRLQLSRGLGQGVFDRAGPLDRLAPFAALVGNEPQVVQRGLRLPGLAGGGKGVGQGGRRLRLVLGENREPESGRVIPVLRV